jgi:hypothetical protein
MSLLCGGDRDIAAVMAFCWRELDAELYTAGSSMSAAPPSSVMKSRRFN